jgi:hypothetical protein
MDGVGGGGASKFLYGTAGGGGGERVCKVTLGKYVPVHISDYPQDT